MHFHPPHSLTAVGRGVEEILGTAFYRLFNHFKSNISLTTHTNRNKINKKTQYKRYCIVWQGVPNLVDCNGCKSYDAMSSISKMLRTPVSYSPMSTSIVTRDRFHITAKVHNGI